MVNKPWFNYHGSNMYNCNHCASTIVVVTFIKVILERLTEVKKKIDNTDILIIIRYFCVYVAPPCECS